MAFVKKTWTDRIAEYINRRRLDHEDGSSELVTVAREEGTVSQEGDAFSAENMNDLEQRVADEFVLINEDIAETNENLSQLNSNFAEIIKTENVIVSVTVGANGKAPISDIPLNIPSGYRILSVVPISADNDVIPFMFKSLTDAYVRNFYTKEVTTSISFAYSYIKI